MENKIKILEGKQQICSIQDGVLVILAINANYLEEARDAGLKISDDGVIETKTIPSTSY
jgi:hypothetical protein